jgi:hypothetical protein
MLSFFLINETHRNIAVIFSIVNDSEKLEIFNYFRYFKFKLLLFKKAKPKLAKAK